MEIQHPTHLNNQTTRGALSTGDCYKVKGNSHEIFIAITRRPSDASSTGVTAINLCSGDAYIHPMSREVIKVTAKLTYEIA